MSDDMGTLVDLLSRMLEVEKRIADALERMAPPQDSQTNGTSSSAKPNNGSKVIISKFPGKCKRCGASFDAGDRIYWSRSGGTLCIPCQGGI
jgi:hypothetical protein